MGVIKSKEEARANFEAAVSYIPARYRAGVSKADWATAAASDQAEANFAAGISEAVAKKKRQAGVRAISNADWQSAAVNKGAPIIGERIRGALGKWMSNWGPKYDRITSLVPTLPPKTTDPMANIDSRLKRVVEEWRK